MNGVQAEKREQLFRDGYCVFEGVVDDTTIARLNEMAEWTIAQIEPEHFEKRRSQGCIVPFFKYPHPAFTAIIADPRAMAVLESLGFPHPRVWSGYLISKPPSGPRLFWHEDGVIWRHPIAYTDQPQQYFLMWYLVDTTPENGCLRIIPGSHRKRHPVHNLIGKPHNAEISSASDLSLPEFKDVDGEIDVPVHAGDLVIGDSRLLHSAHENTSDRWRTALTIWYWPAYEDLPEEVQALIASRITENAEWTRWVEETKETTGHLIPVYKGDAEPIVGSRKPGPELK